MPPDVKRPHFRAVLHEPKFTGQVSGWRPSSLVRARPRTIKVYSERGRGTTFKLLFPALEEGAHLPEAA